MTSISAKHWNESSGICDCCGNQSRTIWGDLGRDAEVIAVYYVQWTVDQPQHYPNIDLVLGPWGEGADPQRRYLVSLLYRPAREGGSFMVIDSDQRPAHRRGLCGLAMARNDVVGTPLAAQVFDLVDALWLTEPRMAQVKALDTLA